MYGAFGVPLCVGRGCWGGGNGAGGPGVRLNYVQGPRGEKNFGRRWTEGTGGLKN